MFLSSVFAFFNFVFVAEEQKIRICKNTVLITAIFSSKSGFYLSPLIGENVTISVLLWMQRRDNLPPHVTLAKQ